MSCWRQQIGPQTGLPGYGGSVPGSSGAGAPSGSGSGISASLINSANVSSGGAAASNTIPAVSIPGSSTAPISPSTSATVGANGAPYFDDSMMFPSLPGVDMFGYGPGLDVISTGSAAGPASSNPIPLDSQSLSQQLPSVSAAFGGASIATGSNVPAGLPSAPVSVTVLDLGQPAYPNITATFAPVPVTQDCGWWADLNALIAQNPLIATAILATTVFLIAKAKEGRRGR